MVLLLEPEVKIDRVICATNMTELIIACRWRAIRAGENFANDAATSKDLRLVIALTRAN